MARPRRVVGDGKFSSGKGRQSLDEFRKEYLRFRNLNSKKNKSTRGEFQGGSFQRYKDQPGERPMATERIPETPVRDIKPDLKKGPYLMGPRGKVPEGLPVEQGQTLSGYNDSRPIPESNAEGIGRAENDMGKEATKPKQPNQMDSTDAERPGGSYGKKTNPVGGLNEFRKEYIRFRNEEKPARQQPTQDTKDREWRISGKKQQYLRQRLAELDAKKQRDLLNRAGSGTRTNQTK